MAELRALLESLGYEDVVTLLQSGNAVLRAGGGAAAVARGIEEAIAAELGLAVRVLLRTPAELREIAARNPFLGREDDLAKLHVVFLDGEPAPARVGGTRPAALARRRVRGLGPPDLPPLPKRRRPDEALARLLRAAPRRRRHRPQLEHAPQADRC